MAQSEFKYNRLRLMWSILKVNWRQETTYYANTFVGLITPLMYVVSFLVFVEVLFRNIDTLAGYNRDEMFFLLFIGQLVFYSYAFWGSMGSYYMEQDVNDGKFDYVLTKPVPALFYTTFRRTEPFSGLMNFFGPLTPAWLVINWGNLDISMALLPIGILMIGCASLLYHQVQFVMSLMSFWTGRGKQASLVVYAANSQTIPIEGFSLPLKALFLLVIPVFYSAVIASVMLGKSSPWPWLALILLMVTVFSFLKRYTWAKAIRQYSSASS